MDSDNPITTFPGVEPAPAERRIPTSMLPASQRPTPTRSIRLHTDTHREADERRYGGETWDAFMRRLLDGWRRKDGGPNDN